MIITSILSHTYDSVALWSLCGMGPSKICLGVVNSQVVSFCVQYYGHCFSLIRKENYHPFFRNKLFRAIDYITLSASYLCVPVLNFWNLRIDGILSWPVNNQVNVFCSIFSWFAPTIFYFRIFKFTDCIVWLWNKLKQLWVFSYRL